jgi:hypothetical protein
MACLVAQKVERQPKGCFNLGFVFVYTQLHIEQQSDHHGVKYQLYVVIILTVIQIEYKDVFHIFTPIVFIQSPSQ